MNFFRYPPAVFIVYWFSLTAFAAQTQSHQAQLDLIHLNVGGTPLTFSRSLLDHHLAKGSRLKDFCNHPIAAGFESENALFVDGNAQRFEYLIDCLRNDEKPWHFPSFSDALTIRSLAEKWLPRLVEELDTAYFHNNETLVMETKAEGMENSLLWRFDTNHKNRFYAGDAYKGSSNVVKFCLDEWQGRDRNKIFLLLPKMPVNLPGVVLYDIVRKREIGSLIYVMVNPGAVTSMGGLQTDMTQVRSLIASSTNNHICFFAGLGQFGIFNLRTGKRALNDKSFSLLADCQNQLNSMVDIEN